MTKKGRNEKIGGDLHPAVDCFMVFLMFSEQNKLRDYIYFFPQENETGHL